MKKRSRNYLIPSERTLYLFANFVREMGAGQRIAGFQASCHLAQGAHNELELAQVAAACLAVEGVRAQGEALDSRQITVERIRRQPSHAVARQVEKVPAIFETVHEFDLPFTHGVDRFVRWLNQLDSRHCRSRKRARWRRFQKFAGVIPSAS